MLFNSYIFIFLFLPLCLVGFYILQKRKATLAKVWLTCFSLWFYGYFNYKYLLIMLGSIAGNYMVHVWIVEKQKKEADNRPAGNVENKESWKKPKYGIANSKGILSVGIGLNLLVLGYFKYFDFFLENINSLFGSSIPLKNILLPLGISFFTFQQISFLVDSYRGELDTVSFLDYALFVSFFPQLIAGPIVIHEEMLPQFERIGKDDRSSEERTEIFIKGIYVFVLGLAKKILIADTFGRAVDLAFSNVNGINGLESLLTILFYSLQLYFDFSGYCDMAKGIAGMFGMRIANNFNSPYKAVNIVDFWKRWHITLSRFFTKNIYIPLGGNRKGELRMYLNYFIIFFLSGIWHGAGWNFVLWGLMHGVLYIITKWWMKQKQKAYIAQEGENTCEEAGILVKLQDKILQTISCVLTFLYVSVAWVYFRAASMEQGTSLLRNLFVKDWTMPGSGFADCFNLGEFWYVLKILKIAAMPYAQYYLMALFTAAALGIVFFGKNVEELATKFKTGILNALVTALLFIWCVVSLSGVSTFLYFNF